MSDLLFVLDKRSKSLEQVTIAEEPVQLADIACYPAHDDEVLAKVTDMPGEVFVKAASTLHSRVDRREKNFPV